MSSNSKGESTSFRDNIIKRKLNDATASLIDGLNFYLGLENKSIIGPVTPVDESKEISNALTSLFTNTKINAYIYKSKIPNAFTIPTLPVGPTFLKTAGAMISFLPFNIADITIRVFNDICAAIMYVRNFMHGVNYEKANSLTYDPKTKKFTITIPYITCYISSGLIELLDNNDEVIAILLHEVGHNTQLLLGMLSRLVQISIGGITLDLILYAIFENKVDGVLEMLYDAIPFVNKSFMLLIALLIVLTYINNYFDKRNEIYADEFSIKCGYGEAMHSAMVKLHNYSRTPLLNNSFKKLSMNLFDKGMHFISSIRRLFVEVLFMMNLGSYPSMNDREQYIEDKTKKFNSEMINKTDRSEHFDNRIFI